MISEKYEDGFACIDPRVGEDILALVTPGVELEAAERELLTAHVEACAHCALLLDLERRLATETATRLPRPVSARPTNASGWHAATRWGAAMALAAGLACALILPPQPVGPTVATRGEPTAEWIRPVEGEVFTAGDLEIGWSPVPGADAYRIALSDEAGTTTWITETETTELTIPQSVGIERDTPYRLVLATIPADLLPPGRVSVGFRVGGLLDVALHRLRYPQPLGVMLMVLGAGLLTLATLVNAGRRRSSRAV